MKRIIFVVAAVVFLLSVLVLPVMAAASYAFYPVGATYDLNAEFSPYDDISFLHDSLLPSGEYYITFDFIDEISGAVTTCVSAPFELAFADSPYAEYDAFSEVTTEVSLGDGDNLTYLTFQVAHVQGFTGLIISFFSEVLETSMVSNVVFHSVAPDGFSSYITADMLQAVLDQVISLLPVLLAVIVGCVGLRKAIAWLLDVMRSS